MISEARIAHEELIFAYLYYHLSYGKSTSKIPPLIKYRNIAFEFHKKICIYYSILNKK